MESGWFGESDMWMWFPGKKGCVMARQSSENILNMGYTWINVDFFFRWLNYILLLTLWATECCLASYTRTSLCFLGWVVQSTVGNTLTINRYLGKYLSLWVHGHTDQVEQQNNCCNTVGILLHTSGKEYTKATSLKAYKIFKYLTAAYTLRQNWSLKGKSQGGILSGILRVCWHI